MQFILGERVGPWQKSLDLFEFPEGGVGVFFFFSCLKYLDDIQIPVRILSVSFALG